MGRSPLEAEHRRCGVQPPVPILKSDVPELEVNYTSGVNAVFPGERAPPWLSVIARTITRITSAALMARRSCLDRQWPCALQEKTWVWARCILLHTMVVASSLLPASEGNTLYAPALGMHLTSVFHNALPAALFGPLRDMIGVASNPTLDVFSAADTMDRTSISLLNALVKAEWRDDGFCQKAGLHPQRYVNVSLSPSKIFVVVPGFGDAHHLPTLHQNIAWVKKQQVFEIRCIIYVYHMVQGFGMDMEALDPCLVKFGKGHWPDFVKVAPSTMWADTDYVLIIFDNVVIHPDANLQRMVEIMTCNGLGVLSPSYDKRCCACKPARDVCQSRRWCDPDINELVCTPRPLGMWYQDWSRVSSVGRRVSFIDVQFTLMTPQSFKCYQDLIDTDVDHSGWGATKLFPFACSRHCMGILDETVMYDSAIGSYGYDHAERGTVSYKAKYSVPDAKERSFANLLDPLVHCGGRAHRHSHQYPLLLHSSQIVSDT